MFSDKPQTPLMTSILIGTSITSFPPSVLGCREGPRLRPIRRTAKKHFKHILSPFAAFPCAWGDDYSAFSFTAGSWRWRDSLGRPTQNRGSHARTGVIGFLPRSAVPRQFYALVTTTNNDGKREANLHANAILPMGREPGLCLRLGGHSHIAAAGRPVSGRRRHSL